MKILICGYGNIGKHIFKEFEKVSSSITIYDKYKEPYNNDKILEDFYDIAFICVPTEKKDDGSADISEVIDITSRIHTDVIVIKSAIPIGTCDLLISKGICNVVVSPEYYGTTQHSLESPNFAILGGQKDLSVKVSRIYSRVKDGSFKFIFVDAKTAELAKYMENCWIATKVTFCNEFATIANYFNINYEELRECFIADERVSPSHTYVYPDKPYYDSHCLNKDIPALIYQCKENNIDTPLMDAVLDIKETRSRKKFTL